MKCCGTFVLPDSWLVHVGSSLDPSAPVPPRPVFVLSEEGRRYLDHFDAEVCDGTQPAGFGGQTWLHFPSDVAMIEFKLLFGI